MSTKTNNLITNTISQKGIKDVSRAYGHVIQYGGAGTKTTPTFAIHFADIPTNPDWLRDSDITFEFDPAHPTPLKSGDWVEARWNKNALYSPTYKAIRLEGSMGRAEVKPLDRTTLDAIQQGALKELETQHKKRVSQLPGPLKQQDQTRPVVSPHNAVKTNGDVKGVGNQLDFSSPSHWLPVPVPMPISAQEALFDDHYFRIGYVSFTVDSPVEDIQISEILPFRSIQTMRSRAPIQKDNWHAVQQVSFSLTLNGNKDINSVLLPLSKMFRRSPFLPVFNKTLLDQGITALALQSMSVETIPGFPNSLRARFVCYTFNWETYLSGIDQLEGMDSLFCYPLLKLWIETPRDTLPNHIPLLNSWDGEFRLAHPAESWIQAVTDLPAVSSKYQGIQNEKAASREIKTNLASNFLMPTLLVPQGFTGEAASTIQNVVGQKVYLKDKWGRAVVDGTEYIFFRPETEQSAIILLSSPELVEILVNPVEIELVGGNPVSWRSSNWSVISVSDFKQQLSDAIDAEANHNAGGQGTLVNLHNKGYTFLLTSPAIVLDRVLKIATPTAPTPNIENNIVPDDGDAISGPGMVIENITATVENILAPLQVRGHRTPTFQYLGSHAIYYQISGTLSDKKIAGRIQTFMEKVNELGRRYRGTLDGTPFGGFVLVENELFQFLGTRSVLPVKWEVSNVPGFPEALRFQMTLVEFDATQRRLEALKDLNVGLADDPSLARRSQQDPLTLNYFRQSDFNRRLRLTEVYPDLALPTHKELAKWLHDIQKDQIWDWTNDVPYTDYSFLGPDEGGTGWQWSLETRQGSNIGPRFSLEQAEFTIADALQQDFLNLSPPTNLNRFADPDFYCAPSQRWGKDLVDTIITDTKNLTYQYTDTYGIKALHVAGKYLDIPSSTSPGVTDPNRRIDSAQSQVGNIKPVGASLSPVDGLNLQPETSANPTLNPDGTVAPGSSPKLEPLPADLPTIRPASIAPNDGGTPDSRFRYYEPTAEFCAKHFGLPLDVFFAVIDKESGWNSQAKSADGGALGFGQLRSAARQETGLDNPFDPAANLFAAAQYLRSQIDSFGGDIVRGVGAYNQGAGTLHKIKGGDGLNAAARDYLFSTNPNNLGVYERKKKYSQYIASTGKVATKEAAIESKKFTNGYGYPLSAIKGLILQPTPDVKPALDESLINELQAEVSQAAATLGALVGGSNLDEAQQIALQTKEQSLASGRRIVAEANLPSTQSTKRFIKPEWLVKAGTDPTQEPVTFDSVQAEVAVKGAKGESWYYIKPENLQEFLTQRARHGVSLQTTKVPERLPQKNTYDYPKVDSNATPKTIEEIFFEPVENRDMFQDTRKEIIQGRLLGAFPTFYVALVDGGRSLRIWRLYDHVYGMLGVTKIAVHRTRKGPVDTAVVGFSNMYGHLTSQQYEIDRIQTQDTRGIWNIGACVRGYLAWLDPGNGESLQMWAQHLDRLMLKPGSRLHIRLGYGADAVQLPIVFNGVISEVPLSEGEVEVVALSDGVELTNDLAPNALQGSMPVTRLNSYFGGGLNPRELIMSFMAPNSWLDSIANAAGQVTNITSQGLGGPGIIGNVFYYNFRNEYGIEHFGSPVRKFLGFDDGEIGVNIYNPGFSTPLNRSSAWDNFATIFQPAKWDSNLTLIGINMGGATPWGIIETARHTIPDYIVAVEPVELRSTLFLGKGWFPLYGNYRDNIDGDATSVPKETPREQLFQWKPFQQVHILHSDWNLIGNNVVSDLTNVITKVQAIGTYNGWLPGSSDLSNEAGFVMMLDEYILDEFQKFKVVESGLYSTFGMKLTDATANGGGEKIAIGLSEIAISFLAKIPQLAVLGGVTLAEPFARSFLLSRRVLDHYGAMTLKDHVKEMYQGPLTMKGNGSIKPYDFIGITDNLSGLNGMAEVREVDQLMSLETGFITEVTPDCIANYQDFEGQNLFLWLSHAITHFAASFAAARFVGAVGRTVSPLATTTSLDTLIKEMEGQIKEDTKNGVAAADISNKVKVVNQIRDRVSITKTALSRARGKNAVLVRDILEKIWTDPEYIKAVSTVSSTTKSKLAVQRFLLGVPSSKAAGAASKLTQKSLDALNRLKQQIPNRAVLGAGKVVANSKVKSAQKVLSNLADNKKIAQVTKAMANKSVEAADQGIADAIAKLAEAKKMRRNIRIASAGRRAVDFSTDAISWTRKLFNEGASNTVIAGVINIALGSLADWATRAFIARQCLTLLPLRIHDKELSAGITGHRGAVYGDVLIGKSALLQKAVSWARESPFGQLIPVLGDVASSGATYETKPIPGWLQSPDQRHNKVP